MCCIKLLNSANLICRDKSLVQQLCHPDEQLTSPSLKVGMVIVRS